MFDSNFMGMTRWVCKSGALMHYVCNVWRSASSNVQHHSNYQLVVPFFTAQRSSIIFAQKYFTLRCILNISFLHIHSFQDPLYESSLSHSDGV